jgi:hypothetical protein
LQSERSAKYRFHVMAPGAPGIDLGAFLGTNAWRVVSTLPDRGLRERMTQSIAAAAAALVAVDKLDLAPHELADLETPNVEAWNALAPDVRTVLVTVRSSCDTIIGLFPPSGKTQEQDAEMLDPFGLFASDEEPTAPGGGRGQLIDGIVKSSTERELDGLADNVGTLVEVLKRDILGFGEKLRNPQVVGDRWFLLGEVHQFVGQCAQCLEAIVATMLSAVATGNLGDMLPRYVDATKREVLLRRAVVDLAHDLSHFNGAFAKAPDANLGVFVSGLRARLQLFSATPAYGFLKPQDKRAVILMRIFLNTALNKGVEPQTLRNEVEGFEKFLALLRDISWRDILADHDRRLVGELQLRLAAGAGPGDILPYLESVYGSYDGLDELIRSMRKKVAPQREILQLCLTETLQRLGPGKS